MQETQDNYDNNEHNNSENIFKINKNWISNYHKFKLH